MKVIELKDVWEQYRIKFVRERRVFWEHIWALQGINLEIEKGECVGIIGENGAGKTTLLKVVAGMLCPDKGKVNVEGRVSCLMELGTGFHPELTGRENIFLNAGLYGLSKEEIEKKFGQIVEFSGIGKFIDAIVKSYSQGMYMRLAFALAIHVDPDILLIDDILAIGDEDAQRKCIKKIFELKEKSTTVLFVTHNMNLANTICKRSILLQKGRLVKDAQIAEVIEDYLSIMADNVKKSIPIEKIVEEAVPRDEKITAMKSMTITDGNTRLWCDAGQKRIKIFYRNKEVTQGNGLYIALCLDNRWYHSFDAYWQVEKQHSDKLLLKLKYPTIPLTQVFYIELIRDNTIDIKIDMELTKEVAITHRDVRLEVNHKYTDWITPNEEGNFQGGRFINGLKHIKLKNYKIKEMGFKPNLKERLPGLVIDFSMDDLKRIIFLHKRIEQEIERIDLRCLEIIPPKEQNLLPGTYHYFHVNLMLDKELELKGEILNTTYKIGNNNLLVIFDEGRAKIFHSNKELTTGLGMYTSVCSSGIWYDSFQASWDVQEIRDNKIIICGFWPYIPISQTWQIEILDNQTIAWEMRMRIYRKLCSIELEQANLMLVSSYKNWIALGENKGVFLDDFAQDYDISPYRFWYGPVKGAIKTSGSKLPPVSFIYIGNEGTLFRSAIENSDNLYNARKLLYQKGNLREFNDPIEYEYFKGLIKVGPNE